jgi:hypothetical protein
MHHTKVLHSVGCSRTNIERPDRLTSLRLYTLARELSATVSILAESDYQAIHNQIGITATGCEIIVMKTAFRKKSRDGLTLITGV